MDLLASTAESGWSRAWAEDPTAADTIADEVASLAWTYVSRLSHDRRPIEIIDRLAQLSNQDAAFLRRLRFVTSDAANALVYSAAPRLLRRLPQSTKRTTEMAREARGRIDWPGTLRERLRRGGDLSILAVSRSDRDTDLPENRALVFLLERLTEMARILAFRPDGLPIPGRAAAAEIGSAALRLRTMSALAAIPSPKAVFGFEKQVLRVSRLSEFRNEVSRLLELYDGLFSDGSLSTLRHLLGERVWLPQEPERLFELWILFTMARSLEVAGWQVTNLKLLGVPGDTSPTIVLAKGDANVSIGYQSLPREMVAASRYTPLLDTYGISGGARRPDFVIAVELAGKSERMLVEAKLSANRTYIADGIYKVLGYLADFSAFLGTPPPTRAVLIVWSGLQLAKPANAKDAMVILDAAAVRRGLIAELIEQHLDYLLAEEMLCSTH